MRLFLCLSLVLMLPGMHMASATQNQPPLGQPSLEQPPLSQLLRQTIPGMPVSLILPPDFHPAQDFTGFVNDKTGASILAVVFPASVAAHVEAIYSDRKKFTAMMHRQHFIIENHMHVKTTTGEAILIYSGTQSDGTTVYDKWATLVSGKDTYMISLQSPKQANLAPETAAALFRSIRIDAGNSLERQVAALPFTFTTVAPFIVQATVMGAAVKLQAEQKPTSSTGPVSMYIIHDTQTYNSGDIRLAQNMYIASIRQAFELKETIEEKQTLFAGKTGNRLIATGISPREENITIMLYTALDDTGKAIYLQAMGAKEDIFSLKQQIEQSADSIRLKPRQ